MASRRNILTAGLIGLPLALKGMGPAFASSLSVAPAQGEQRLVFIIQRGAADGLHIAAPLADPGYGIQRAAFKDDFDGGTKLDSTFTLHPNLPFIGDLYAKQQALFIPAVATPYDDRSHFDGQNVLETGNGKPYAVKSGWLNRLLTQLPKDEAKAVAVATTVPLALRGSVNVPNVAPTTVPGANEDLLGVLGKLYGEDEQLNTLWSNAMATRETIGEQQSGRFDAKKVGAMAGSLLGPSGNARIAFIETDGWDTHATQSARLKHQLGKLDALVQGLRESLGSTWNNTLVLVATEFGRTARINGTRGTDHGNGSLAMLFGGSVAGGKVVGDWPGLATKDLYQGRDLQPTTDLFSLLGDCASCQFGLDPDKTMSAIFPQTKSNAAQFSSLLV